MNCENCRDKLSEYLDGQLPRRERRALERHIARCADCDRELRLWRRTLEAVSRLPRQSAPEGFAGRVCERIGAWRAAPAPRRMPKLVRFVPYAAAAAALLLVTVGLTLRFTLGPPAEEGRVPRTAMLPGETEAQKAEDLPREEEAGERLLASKEAERRARERAAKALAPAGPPAPSEAAVEHERAEPEARDKMALEADLERAEREGAAAAGAPSRLTPLLFGKNALKAEDSRKRRGVLVFSQKALPKEVEPVELEEPHQILTIAALEPFGVMQRTVMAANQRGIKVQLVMGAEGDERPREMELALKVPAAAYTALLRQISDLAPPQNQRLANTLWAREQFFRDMLRDYDAYRWRADIKELPSLRARYGAAGGERLSGRGRDRIFEEESARGLAETREKAAVGPAARPEAVREVNLLIRVVHAPAAAERESRKKAEPVK